MPLTTGTLDPRDLLTTLGRDATARYLVSEVQREYRDAGVYLNDKHIEVIVRQMLRFVSVRNAGDMSLLPGEIVGRFADAELDSGSLLPGHEPGTSMGGDPWRTGHDKGV